MTLLDKESVTMKRNAIELPATAFVRQTQLIPCVLPFSAATLWRKVKNGSFPAPVKLSDRVTAWKTDEVREWLDSKA